MISSNKTLKEQHEKYEKFVGGFFFISFSGTRRKKEKDRK